MTQPDPTAELMAEITSRMGGPCDHEKVRALIRAGIRPEATDDKGDTLAMQCANWGRDAGTLKLLIDAGVPLDAKNARNMTALAFAAWFDREDIARALIAAGAKVSGGHELGLALNAKHKKIAAALIEAGADVNEPLPGDGSTPLMLAVMNCYTDIAARLLEKGCSLDPVRASGKTALEMADEMKSPIADLIRREAEKRLVTDLREGTRQPVAVRTLRLKNTAARLA